MAEVNQGPAIPPAEAIQAYRPLSGWAVAGLGLGLLYAGLVVTSFGFFFAQQTPLFLPGFTLLLALAGVVVSYLAQRRIQNSDGVLGGQALARWGLLLALFSGLGYLVFTFTTGLALASQADAFLLQTKEPEPIIPESGFFPHLLRAGKDTVELHKAFLLSLDPANRAGDPRITADMIRLHDSVAAGEKGRLTQFREHWLVYALQMLEPAQVSVKALGTRDWTLEAGRYVITRTYRIGTPELIMELDIPVISSDAVGEGKGRQWFVGFANIEKKSQSLTKVGNTLRLWRGVVYKYLDEWTAHWVQGKPASFQELDKTAWENVATSEYPKEHLIPRLEALFQGTGIHRISVQALVQQTPWQIVDGKVEISYPFVVNFEWDGLRFPPVQLDGYFIVRSLTDVDPANPDSSPAWRVHGVEITSLKSSRPAAGAEKD